MKRLLILIIFNSIFAIANEQMSESNCTDCKAIFSSDIEIEHINTKISNISVDEIATILEDTLRKIRIYKMEKNREIENINSRLERVMMEFTEYREKKDIEVEELKSKLALYQELSTNQQEQITIRTDTIQPPTPPSTWVEIVVEDGVDIFQLALKYYGNKDKYEQIYLANRETIEDDLQIKNGMFLKIPITEQFEEKPMFINMD